MPFQILIDGYNLLFTAGFEGRSRQRGWLGQARQRLIQHLEAHLEPDMLAKTLIVFDVSADVLRERRDDPDYQAQSTGAQISPNGIQIAFAFEFDEADDMLENLIRQHSSPKNLSVISSDNRVRKCAMARRAIAIRSDEFLNQLEQPTGPQQTPAHATENEMRRDDLRLTDREVQQWLREFGEEAAE